MSDGVSLDNLQKVCMRQEGQYQRCMLAGRAGWQLGRRRALLAHHCMNMRLSDFRVCEAVSRIRSDAKVTPRAEQHQTYTIAKKNRGYLVSVQQTLFTTL